MIRTRHAMTVFALVLSSFAVAGGIGGAPADASPAYGPAATAAGPGLADGISARTSQRMLAQVPLDRAAEQIRQAAAASAAGRAGLEQIQVRPDAGTLVIYWHGRMPGSVTSRLGVLRRSSRILVRQSRYGLAELNRAVRDVLHSGRRVVSVGPLPDGSGIRVGVAGTVPAISERAAQRRYHSPVPVRLFSERPARLLTCTANPSDTLNAGSRCYDLAAFWGGAVIDIRSGSSVWGFCSTGFGVHYSSGATGMLTAGHCIQGEAPSGSTWWNGQNTTELGSTGHSPFLGSTTASHDSGVIVTPAGSGTHYYDGPSIFAGDTYNTKVVVGQASTNVGDWVCESGSFGGVLCNVQAKYTNQTVVFNGGAFTISGLVQASGANSSQPAPGDSGGPVFSLAGTGKVTAKGTITGTNGVYLFYTPMNVISADLGVSVNTG